MRKLISLFLVLMIPAFGQDDDLFYLTDMVVTATRTDTLSRYIGRPFTVVTALEIEQRRALTIEQALSGVPGLSFAQNGPTGLLAIFSRGSNQYHTKVLIDGVPIQDVSATQVSAQPILSTLNMSDVERIEVVRGSQSLLYGSESIGGAINIITKGGYHSPFKMTLEMGEHGYSRVSASTAMQTGIASFRLGSTFWAWDGVTSIDLDGQRDNDDYENFNFSGDLNLKLSPDMDLSFQGAFTDVNEEFDSAFGGSQNQDSHLQIFHFRTQLERRELLDGLWNVKLGASVMDSQRAYRGPGFFDTAKFAGETYQFDIENEIQITDNQRISAGVFFRDLRAHGDSNMLDESYNVSEYFIQDQIMLTDDWNLTVGGRLTDHDLFGSHFTYQVSTAYVTQDGMKLTASYGTGFRAPSPYELFSLFGDQDLDPEESTSWDVGVIRRVTRKVVAGVSYFENDIKDQIDFIWPQGYLNNSEAHIKGVEVFVDWRPKNTVDVKATYTHLDPKAENGTDLPRRAHDRASLNVNYKPTHRLNLNSDVIYVGDSYDDMANTVDLDSYVLWNLAVSYEVNDNVTVFGKVLNVTDEEYQTVANFKTLGRTVFFGVSIEL